MGNPKSKGSGFERDMCEAFSLWWSQGARDDIFIRSSNSGGRFTNRAKRGKTTHSQGGDFTYNDSTGRPFVELFSGEFKTGYGTKRKSKKTTMTTIVGWCCLDLIDTSQAETVLEKFWKQCAEDASKTERSPMLVFRRNLRAPCVALRSIAFKSLEVDMGHCTSTKIVIVKEKMLITIIGLKDFFKWLDPKKLGAPDYDQDNRDPKLSKPQTLRPRLIKRRECDQGTVGQR